MRTLLAIFVLSYASAAAAAVPTHYGHGTPVTISVMSDGTADVFFDPTTQILGTPPACTGYTNGALPLRFDTRTDGGKSMLAALLTAHANSTPVYYFGSNDCATYAGKESLTQISLN